jgi:hypothetical protein
MKRAAIFGLPRSGTTWISKVTDSSKTVFYAHEPDYVRRVPCLPYVTRAEDWEIWQPHLERYVASLPRLGTARSMLKRPIFLKEHSGWYGQLQDLLWKSRLRIHEAAERLGIHSEPIAAPTGRLVDLSVWKSVEQTGNIGVWLRALPDQKLIHIVRHPCGFVESVLRGESMQLLRSPVPMSEDVGILDHVARTEVARKLGFDLTTLHSLNRHQRLAAIWLCLNEQALADSEGCSNYHCISFDAFCGEPQFAARSLFESLGIEFSECVEAFLLRSTKIDSTRYFGTNRQSARVPGSWKSRLSDRTTAEILDIAGLGERCCCVVPGLAGRSAGLKPITAPIIPSPSAMSYR